MSDHLILVTSEDHKVEVDGRIKTMSNLIHSILQDAEPNEEIHLSKLSRENLGHILEYCNQHNYESPPPLPRPLPSVNLRDHVSEWDASFIEGFSDDALIDLVNVCDYLDIKCILELCLAKIAIKFKGKDVNELRQEYSIEEEFTDEVEEGLKKEFPWALEGDEARLGSTS
jgi:hypothetical protein